VGSLMRRQSERVELLARPLELGEDAEVSEGARQAFWEGIQPKESLQEEGMQVQVLGMVNERGSPLVSCYTRQSLGSKLLKYDAMVRQVKGSTHF
jgi:hypothetical protein